jgi:hypothetical protein
MTTKHDADQRLQAFLEAGPTQLPDRTYDAVRAEIEHTRQRVVLGPWRNPEMSMLLRSALVAAAVIVLAFGATRLLPAGTNVGGQTSDTPGPSTTPTPTPSPSAASIVPLLQTSGTIASGRYRFSQPYTPRDFTIYVPDGWSAAESSFIAKAAPGKQFASLNDAVISLSPWVVDGIYTDGCHTSTGLQSLPGGAGLVSMLLALPHVQASSPGNGTIDGHQATEVILDVPASLDMASCDHAFLRLWPDPGQDTTGGWHVAPGQHMAIWVVDTQAGQLVLAVTTNDGVSSRDQDAVRAMLDSIRFEPLPAPTSPPAASPAGS